MNGLKVKVSDSLDNVPNENVVTQQVTNQPTDRVTDQLLELLEWLFATKTIRKYISEDYSGLSDEWWSLMLARPGVDYGEPSITLPSLQRYNQ